MTNADDLLSQPWDTALVAKRSNLLFERGSSIGTLPHKTPYEQSPLRYASPPVDWELQRGGDIQIFSPTSSFTFAVAQTGNNIATVFPQAALIASQQLAQAAALVAISLSYAVRNASLGGAIGLFAVIDNRPIIGVGGNADVLVAAITPPGAAEQTWSDVRNNSFSLDVAPMINAGQSVSLYCSCANSALDFVWGVVTFKYVSM